MLVVVLNLPACGVGVLFKTRNPAAIESLTRNLSHRQSGKFQLVKAKVVDVRHTGLGHRVCVDTTTLMTAEEGMIIGSTGWGGIFVCSETHYLPHMNLREFRINAGGVHSYVWGPNDQHLYLSEMRAGTELLCVDIHGNSRVVTVGRAKIERRLRHGGAHVDVQHRGDEPEDVHGGEDDRYRAEDEPKTRSRHQSDVIDVVTDDRKKR